MDNNNYINKNEKNDRIGKVKDFKINYRKLTIWLKKNRTAEYNLMKLILLIDKFQKGYMHIKQIGPNKRGTAFIFVPITTSEDVEKAFSNIIDFASRLESTYEQYNFKLQEKGCEKWMVKK